MLEMSRTVMEKNEASAEELKEWKATILSVPARFVVVSTASDQWWYEYDKREEIGEQYISLYQTAYQKVCGICRLIEEDGKEATTPARIAALFKPKATATPSALGDSITETFIKDVVLVRGSILANPRCHEIVRELDERDGHNNVLNSV